LRKLHWAAQAGLIALILLVFGAVGYVVTRPSSGSQHNGHVVPQAAPHSDGLSDTQDGYRFVPVTVPATRGTGLPLAFRIVDPAGRPETEFQVNQTKSLHFFVVRDDMQAYQHVHPELDGDTWRTAVSVPDGGAYRMYAEFVPKDNGNPLHPTVLGATFVIPGDTTFVPLPPPAERAEADGYTVVRPDGLAQPAVGKVSRIRLRINDPSGAPVTEPEPYLGAYGHLTGFDAVMLSVTHMHPVERIGTRLADGELTFQAQFAERGEHRLFLEFQAQGKIRTAALTVFVT
jgi:hypothetical protein